MQVLRKLQNIFHNKPKRLGSNTLDDLECERVKYRANIFVRCSVFPYEKQGILPNKMHKIFMHKMPELIHVYADIKCSKRSLLRNII